MRRLGLIARCNGTGLSTLTWEFWRHMRPERTLIVYASNRPRAGAHPEWYRDGPGETRTVETVPGQADLAWLLDGIDVLYGAETWYARGLTGVAARAGVETVLHVMPEYLERTTSATCLWAPTGWEKPDRAMLVPVPVAADRFPPRRVEKIRTLYHVESPTPGGHPGGDRNGTRILLDALPHVTEPCRLLIRGHHPPRVEQVGKVDVEWLGFYDGPYHEAWPDVDALVLPRRYAGLSLPMQEAAVQGLPIVTLDRYPESEWFPAEARVPISGRTRQRIWRHHQTLVADARPEDLAATIDRLVADDDLARRVGEWSYEWARGLAWSEWLPCYEAALR